MLGWEASMRRPQRKSRLGPVVEENRNSTNIRDLRERQWALWKM